MKKSLLLLLLLILIATPGVLAAKCHKIACYDLSLFGYSLEMSIEDATGIRPFHRISEGFYGEGSSAIGRIDTIFFEDLEFSIRVDFVAGHLRKVLGRFNPADFSELVEVMEAAYGPARDQSRTIDRPDGARVRQQILGWQFPDARLVLIGDVGNQGFGTIALLRRGDIDPNVQTTAGR